MRWFGDIPTIKLTDLNDLHNGHADRVMEWEYVALVGDAMDEYSYYVIKHLATRKLYRTMWEMRTPEGVRCVTGRAVAATDYRVLNEVKARQVTVYDTVKRD